MYLCIPLGAVARLPGRRANPRPRAYPDLGAEILPWALKTSATQHDGDPRPWREPPLPRPYSIYDVFSAEPFAGNPLAVVHDAVGLDTEQMQSVAREFNFSETTFLERVSDSDDRVRVRIFTPDRELPFAGHPTVGSAVAVAHENVRRRDGGHVQSLTLDEDVGSVAVEVDLANDRVGFASFILPALPRRFEWAPDLGRVAAVLGIAASDIGFDNHVPSAFDAGLPYFMVPVRDLTVMARLNPESRDWRTVFDGGMNHDSAFVYCREAVNEGSSFHARMFWPVGGIREDPATGSAVASFLGTVHAFEVLGAGTHRQVIEQGLEMGRPSFITLEATVQDGAVQSARIGGNAVRVAHGMLED